jgi:DNA mismatch repair protein MutH
MLILQTQRLERREALRRINLLVGKDLRPLADQYGITVWKNGHKNKGWAGQVIEHYLGLAQNSLQAPDFGTWELKVVPLFLGVEGTFRVKESMAITMLEPAEVLSSKFADSHLYDKLRSMIVVARIFKDTQDSGSYLHSAAEFDLDNPEIRKQVEADYEAIRAVIREQGISSLTATRGNMCRQGRRGQAMAAPRELSTRVRSLWRTS